MPSLDDRPDATVYYYFIARKKGMDPVKAFKWAVDTITWIQLAPKASDSPETWATWRSLAP